MSTRSILFWLVAGFLGLSGVTLVLVPQENITTLEESLSVKVVASDL